MTWATAAVDLVKDAVQTGLRILPFSTPTGLVRIGNPDRGSPVLVTCNFDLTVRRVRRALRGVDCYLLVAASRGINVWCAAAGGHFTANEVVSVVKTSGIGELVDHRRLVLPQLAATGVERKAVEERTGWRVVFGPVRAADIPEYLRNHHRKSEAMRKVRFDLPERLEMASMWAAPITLLALVPLAIWWPARIVPFLAIVWGIAIGTFVAFPWLPLPVSGDEAARVAATRRRSGRLLVMLHGWLRPSLLMFVLFAVALAAFEWSLGGGDGRAAIVWSGVGLVVSLLVGLELAGSTPVFKSGMSAERLLTVRLLEERCTGKAMCEQVCPKSCFEVDARLHKATIVAGHECVQCGACVVQCPEDALVFAYPDGRTIPPDDIRRFKLNMLNERVKPL
jgi:NAD-dependent dihydropyrimidine dehydrogenase PreA subunit